MAGNSDKLPLRSRFDTAGSDHISNEGKLGETPLTFQNEKNERKWEVSFADQVR